MLFVVLQVAVFVSRSVSLIAVFVLLLVAGCAITVLLVFGCSSCCFSCGCLALGLAWEH